MNILCCTQSDGLPLFSDLCDAFNDEVKINKLGFVVADSSVYSKWINLHPEFENGDRLILKEWDLVKKYDAKPDLEKLSAYEKELGGEAGLFGAIIADRRLFMGPDCSYSQDYRRRFSDDQLLLILQSGLEEMERLFDELKPDIVIGFICVTMLDYLAYLFAKSRGIKFLNLRPTRVSDRIGFFSTLNDPAPEFVAAYEKIFSGKISKFSDTATKHIQRVKNEHGRYEGVISPSDKPATKISLTRLFKLGSLISSFRTYFSYQFSTSKLDNHVPDPLRVKYFAAVKNPIRARRAHNYLKERYVGVEDLPNLRYVFYPLHTEPEVSLLVYGRPYVNQIEVIRMIAMSLPADTVLVLKEHPWMVGKRSVKAYQKILNIPRVKLVDPKHEARKLIEHCQMVAVITGSVALEAAIIGKPVITFGDCPYNLLPDNMVRRIKDPRHLPSTIMDSIKNYEFDAKAMNSYISAVFETSTSVNLYSVLLGKKNVYSKDSRQYDIEIRRLAEYLKIVVSNKKQPCVTGNAQSVW